MTRNRLQMLVLAAIIILMLLTSIACQPIVDPRSPADATATNVALGKLDVLPVDTPEPPPLTVAPDVVPAEEVGEVAPDPPPAPPCELVKGNISRDGRKLFHVAGMANYNTVKIDEAAGERFFCSVEEAEAAGWVRAGS